VQAMMLRHLRRTIYHASRVASAFILRFWPSGTAFFDVSVPDVMERRTNVMTGAGPMTWNRRYQVKSYLRSALWVVPLVALTLEQVFWALVRVLDYRFAWKGLALGVTGAEAVFNAVTTLTLSFIVFTFGSLLVAIQVAVGQYTPRIIATTLLRDNVIRYTVGLFVFTFIFAVKAAARTEMTVHQLVAFVTGLLGLSCIVAFLFLIDYAARMLRPVSLVKRVENGLAAIESVYPEQFTETQSKI
jgi:uncharacterized membrane protein